MQSPIALRSFVETQNNQNFALKNPLRKAALMVADDDYVHATQLIFQMLKYQYCWNIQNNDIMVTMNNLMIIKTKEAAQCS